jgi:hypothetical protein
MCFTKNVLDEVVLTPLLHGATSQKTAFFIVTAVKTSNLTTFWMFVTAVEVQGMDNH